MQNGPELFTVWTRDQSFKLTRTQLEFDGPNFFTAAFLDHDFMETESKVIYTDRNPKTFAILIEYLSGYDILPLEDNFLDTGGLILAALKRNLIKDAIFFGLNRLVKSFGPSPFPPLLSQSMNLPGNLKAVEWDEYLYQNDRRVFDGVVVLRDVKLRFELLRYENRRWFYIKVVSKVPRSSMIEEDIRSKLPSWIEPLDIETNIVQLFDTSNEDYLEHSEDIRKRDHFGEMSEQDLENSNMAKRPLSFNGISTHLYELSRHPAFWTEDEMNWYMGTVTGSGNSPLQTEAISFYRRDSDNINGILVYGHELYLVPRTYLRGGKVFRRLEMAFLKCSTMEKLHQGVSEATFK